jgi:hypothetical protein
MRFRGGGRAVLGGVLWIAALLLWRRELLGLRLIDALLCFAALVLVPLGLWLRQRDCWPESRLHRLARIGQPLAAALVVASFLPGPGVLAAGLALPWLGVSAALGLAGLLSLPSRHWRRPDELCLDAALLCLPIGAGWLVASRFGAMPMGFGEPIVILTAVHFHYAGFATMVLVGLAGRALAPRSPVLLKPVAWGALLGPPLLAAGITLSPALEAFASAVVVLTLLGYSVLAGFFVRPVLASRAGRVLLAVSAAAPLVSMAWAAAYAGLEYVGRQEIAIVDMARWHGLVNAIGFGLCGLLAFAQPGGRPPVLQCEGGRR